MRTREETGGVTPFWLAAYLVAVVIVSVAASVTLYNHQVGSHGPLARLIPMVLVGVIFTGSQYELFSWDLFITLLAIAAANITIIWLVYVKGKRVRTDIVAIIGIAVVLGLGLPLRLLGII